MNKTAFTALLIGLLSMTAFRCTQNPTADGSGSHTGNPVYGIVYNQDGTRAASAKVKFIPSNYDPITDSASLVIDSTVTNDTGGYKIDSLAADTFNLLAKSGVFVGYRDSIKVKSNTATIAPPCTLKATGSVTGVVQLQPGDNATTVFILFMGTKTWEKPSDSIGNFSVTGLAEGKYAVKILTTLPDYDVMDTSFTIKSGVDSILPAPLKLRYTGIPVPQGLRIECDTMKQIVTLIWNKPTSGTQVQSYNIYRKHQDSASFERIKSGVTDTTYNDSDGIQDITYEYRVAAVDTNTAEGPKSTAVSAIILSGYITVKTIDSINGIRVRPAGLFNFNNFLFIADGWNKKIIKLDINGNFVNEFTGLTNSPSDIVIDSNNNYWVAEFSSNQIEKFDSNWTLLQTWSYFQNQTGDTTIITEPTRLAIDSNSNIFVLYNSVDFSVIEINLQGTVLKNWYIGGQNSNNIALLKSHQFAAAGGPSNILKIYDSTGALLKTVQLCIPLVANSNIGNMAADLQDHLYFNREIYNANPPPSKLYKFDANGTLIARWRCESFSQAGDMVISSSGDIFLGALSPGRIVIFSQRK